jgi:hypothetical protein
MNNDKYVGFDVHLATIVVVVLNEAGKCIMESVIETKGNTIIEFIRGLSGTVHVIFEEGTQSTWLYDLLKPRVAEVVVCNARRHQKEAGENHADRIDANKLANGAADGRSEGSLQRRSGAADAKRVSALLQLSGARCDASDESDQSDLSRERDWVSRAESVSSERARRVVKGVEGARAEAASGVTVSGVG